MATWDQVAIPILRTIIDDVASTTDYSDAELKTLMVRNAYIMVFEIDFNTQYTVDVINEKITPDPHQNSDTAFINLLIFKSVCTLARAIAKKAAHKSITVKDGQAVYSGRDAANFLKLWADDYCKKYEDMRKQFTMSSNMGTYSKMITGPYNPY